MGIPSPAILWPIGVGRRLQRWPLGRCVSPSCYATPFSLLLKSLLGAVLALGASKLSERRANLRKVVLLTLGALITTLVMGGGVAWAVKVIHCPNNPKDPQTCNGTDRKD